ncbi:MAG: anti-sigma factor [Phycisphaeraceae bacterium]|nr:anti-sigma factor [Phycisphaeraceae bacterium]
MSNEHEPFDHDDHFVDRASGDASSPRDLREVSDMDRAAASLQAGITPHERMPEALKSRLITEGEAIVAARSGRPITRKPAIGAWLAAAAAIALASGAGIWALSIQRSKEQAAHEFQTQLASLQEQYESNTQMLANARSRLNDLQGEVADAANREIALAQRLADATSDYESRLAAANASLDQANLKIAQYETPEDPAVLAANRRKLLEVPDTVRLAWSPFDLPDAPAEQRLVRGDVVWNDELQEGYLRFEGLAVNDPKVEQYQVWVIDERGMEQKVSGGVFNATQDGEVIVPIHPGIDVGRVALFAITIEEPGGTWVPDLKRRVVVAPREG